MSARYFFVCSALLLLFTNGANAARYQRTQDGKTLVWNNLRGVAEQATWSGLRDLDGYATGEGTLTWYRLGKFVNSYTGKMVHGKFEGPVIREQGQTKLQTTFVNGNKAGDWSEPGSTHTPPPAPKEKPTKTAETEEPTEEPSVEQPSPSPTLSALPTPSVFPSRSPAPTPTPTSTPRATPTATPTSTPRSTPIATSTPARTPTPTPLRSSMPSPVEQPAKEDFRLDEAVEGQVNKSLQLGSPPSTLPSPVETAPRPGPSPSPMAKTPLPAASPPRVDPNQKHRMIVDLKKQTQSVLAQVRDATGNFRQIDRLDQVKSLPGAVSTYITLLGNQASEFRAKLGYDVTYYECLAEIEAVDSLVLVDQVTSALAAKDAPAARKKISNFTKLYSEPSDEDQKPAWRYLTSAFSLCDRSKNEAQAHLERAQSLSSAGKKSEALREYQEIYRIYPNPITAERIHQLEAQPR